MTLDLVLPSGPHFLGLVELLDNPFWALALVVVVLAFLSLVTVLARRYKRCPSNRVLVVYGRSTSGRVSRTFHGGGAFVLPILEDFEYLSLDPMQIEIPLEGALSSENIRVSVPSVFTVAIGTDGEAMSNAPKGVVRSAHSKHISNCTA